MARMEQCPTCGSDLPGGVQCPKCTSDPLAWQQTVRATARPDVPGAGDKSSGKGRLLVIAGIGLAAVVVVAAFGSRIEDDHTKAVKSCVSAALAKGTDEPAANQFCEAVVTRDEEQAAEAAAKAEAAEEEAVESVEDEGPALPHGVVPDVEGLDLQTAQDTLQSAGYRHIESVDDTGRGRHQMNDSNWVVVRQNPSAGTKKATSYVVYLFVVKYGEE